MDAQRVRALANWVNLSTLLGLAVARAGGASLRRGAEWTWIAEGYRLGWPRVGAFTVGSVILMPDSTMEDLVRRHPRIIEHELAHARQWALCLGLPFLPLYLGAAAWSRLRTGTNHLANPFEVRAGLGEGGYGNDGLGPVTNPNQRTVSRAAERLRCRCSRSRRSRFTSSGS